MGRAARHRAPPVRRRIVAPHFRSLRPVLVPGPRLEEAELLVEHLVHVAEKLDHHAVGIVVIDGDVVADDVADRPPGELDVVARQEIAGALDVRPVADLEGDVMDRGRAVA